MLPPSEQKGRLWTFRWLKQIHKYATRRLKMKVWDLAARRSIWRMVRNNSIPELASEPILISIAREFDQSLDDGNGDFLRDVADASDALNKGDFFEKLNIQTQALLICEELRQELGHPPNDFQVRMALEKILGSPVIGQQWKRVREALAPLK